MLLKNNYYFLKKGDTTRYCEYSKKNDLMLTIADTDFKLPKPMINDIIKFIKKGNLNYSYYDEKLIAAINYWYKNNKKIYNFNLKKENIIFGSGVIPLIQNSISYLTKPGEGIIVQPPVFHIFYDIITSKKRKIIKNNLIYDSKKLSWNIKFDDLENKMADPNNKIFILCNPQNPLGRVWTKNELTKIVALASKYDVAIISDEIWSENIFDNFSFYSLLEINDKKAKIIVFNNQSKTYNQSGAQIGYCISFNHELIEKLRSQLVSRIFYTSSNIISANFLLSGFLNKKNWKWLEIYKKKIQKNFLYFKKNIEKNTSLKITTAQFGYLIWIDLSLIIKTEKELIDKLAKNNLYCNLGSIYGSEYWNFLRVNIGTSRRNLNKIIKTFINLANK